MNYSKVLIALMVLFVVNLSAKGVVWETTDIDSFYYGIDEPIIQTRGVSDDDYSGIENFTMTVKYVGDFNSNFMMLNTPNGTIYWENGNLIIRCFENRNGTGPATIWTLAIGERWMNYDNDSLSVSLSMKDDVPTILLNNEDISLFLGTFIPVVVDSSNITGDYNWITVGYAEDKRNVFPVGYIAPTGSQFSNLLLSDDAIAVGIEGSIVTREEQGYILKGRSLNFTGMQVQNIAVYSMNGRQVMNVPVQNNIVQLDNLSSGMYLLQLSTLNGLSAVKINM